MDKGHARLGSSLPITSSAIPFLLISFFISPRIHLSRPGVTERHAARTFEYVTSAQCIFARGGKREEAKLQMREANGLQLGSCHFVG